ncbi:MAG: hypothetical protein JW873_03265 [Candidatus Saganbacteria bacterium]|nr:hypothetical protein [Candidatus Saganbacteria bacterium]
MMRRNPLFKSFFCLFLLLAFLLGGSLIPDRPAEAKAKKIVRKIKKSKVKRKAKKTLVKKKAVKKKAVRKKAVRKKVVKKVRRVAVKKPAPKKPAKKAFVVSNDAAYYTLPSSGTITQTFAIEEGVGDPEVDALVGAMKSLGALDSYADTSRNTLTVKYNAAKLSSARIIKKLKSLGYTAKRQG